MITAIGPDGARHQFPDETPGDVIDGVMARTYGGGGQTGVASPPVAAAPPSPPPAPPSAAYLAAGGLGVKPGIGAEFGALNDIVRAAASGMTLGGADRIAAGLGSATGIGGTQGDYAGNLAAQRAQTAGFEQAHPYVAGAANLAGAGLGIAAAPEGLIAAPTTAAGRILGGAATGGTVGAIQGGLASPDWTNAGQTAGSVLSGAGVGGVAGGFAGLAGSVLNRTPATPPLTLQDVKTAKNAAYDAADKLGAAYTPEAIGGLAERVKAEALANKINPGLHPKAAATISDLQDLTASGEPVPLSALDQQRQIVNRDVTSSPEKGEQFFGNQIKNNIDQFIANAGPESMAAGTAPEAAAAIQNARDLNTRAAKGQALADALQLADWQAGKNKVSNIDDTTRQRLFRLLTTENWTPQEAAQIESTMKGSFLQNALRSVAKFSPTSFVPGVLEAHGALFGGEPVTATALAAGGYASKKASEAMTNRNVQNLMQTILAGGKTQAPLQVVSPQARQLGAALAGAGASRIAAQPQY